MTQCSTINYNPKRLHSGRRKLLPINSVMKSFKNMRTDKTFSELWLKTILIIIEAMPACCLSLNINL